MFCIAEVVNTIFYSWGGPVNEVIGYVNSNIHIADLKSVESELNDQVSGYIYHTVNLHETYIINSFYIAVIRK